MNWNEENISCWISENVKSARFIEKLNTKHGIYIKVTCPTCNKIFERDWYVYRKNKRFLCCDCLLEQNKQRMTTPNENSKSLLDTYPQIKNIWSPKNKLNPENYLPHSNQRVLFKCNVCGNEWDATICSVTTVYKRGFNPCRNCKFVYLNKESFLKELKNKNPQIELIGEYVDAITKTLFKCKVCGNQWLTMPKSLVRNTSYGVPATCGVCKKKVIGPPPEYLNSIWANKILRNIWSKYFDEQFMKTNSAYSRRYFDIKCPDCGKVKKTTLSNLRTRGFCCVCNSNASYPNRFIYSFLNKLNIEYEAEYSPFWAHKKRYDVYIPSLNTIIENNGMQHYTDKTFYDNTLSDTQKNDKEKMELAYKNGITNYIVLDCTESTVYHMKKSIIDSALFSILKLKDKLIDWDSIDMEARENTEKHICTDWEKDYDMDRIIEKYHKKRQAIRKILKNGAKYGWCSYDSNWNNRPVFCVNSQKRYGAISNATCITGVKCSDILCCCEGKKESAGVDPQTGLPLTWRYADDYVANISESGKIQMQNKEKIK